MEVTAPLKRRLQKDYNDASWDNITGRKVEDEQNMTHERRRQTNKRCRNAISTSYKHNSRNGECTQKNIDTERNGICVFPMFLGDCELIPTYPRVERFPLSLPLSPPTCFYEGIDIQRNRASCFLHPPIDFTRRQIRLIRILPCTTSSQMDCEFVLSMVDNPAKPYTALSYIWGIAERTSDIVKITLEGQDFWIRRNLWNFLRRARLDPSLCRRLFWIDAICINQVANGSKGSQEKNHQVNMMKDIYQNACEVIGWLGEPSSGTKRCQQLRHLEKYLITQIWSTETTCAWEALSYIGECSYWSRIWIIQELLVARKVIFRFGLYSFDWQAICALETIQNYEKVVHLSTADGEERLPIVPNIHIQTSSIGITFWRVVFPIIHWSKNKAQQKSSIIDALFAFQHQECSNPLDKIYGLLGLVEDQPVQADYAKTTLQLFEDLVRYSNRHILIERDVKEGRFHKTLREFPGILRQVLGLADEETRGISYRSGITGL